MLDIHKLLDLLCGIGGTIIVSSMAFAYCYKSYIFILPIFIGIVLVVVSTVERINATKFHKTT